MPAADVWVPWVASVEGGLDGALTGRRRRKGVEHLWRGDLEIAGRARRVPLRAAAAASHSQTMETPDLRRRTDMRRRQELATKPRMISPDDARLKGMDQESVAGKDQIAQMLAATPSRATALPARDAGLSKSEPTGPGPSRRRPELHFQPEEMLRTLERHQVRHVVIGGVGARAPGA
jgi:hypothetical protein